MTGGGWHEETDYDRGGRIEIQTRPRLIGVADDLRAMGQAYDAVLVGRRGIGALQEMVMGSVSRQVLQKASNLAVWIVP